MMVNQFAHKHYDPSIDNEETVKLLQFMQTTSQKRIGKDPSKKELMELRRRSSDIFGGVLAL